MISPRAAAAPDPLLHIDSLEICLGETPLVRGVSLSIAPGEMLGLVGESGCGKSITALSVLRLLAEPPLRTRGGRILFAGRDLLTLPEKALTAVRGNDIGMIFQEPMTSLNPAFRIGAQIAETVLLHERIPKRAARQRATDLLATVGFPAPSSTFDRYPHQLSGGQRQRVMIAIALACTPALLIADEPTTALDVTVQAQILELLESLRREHGMAVLLITHDLGVVRRYCDRVAVMYSGEVVEEGRADAVFAAPRHRYTQALMDTIPASNPPGTRLPAIGGRVPSPAERPPACSFEPRCHAAIPRCAIDAPILQGPLAANRAPANPAQAHPTQAHPTRAHPIRVDPAQENPAQANLTRSDAERAEAIPADDGHRARCWNPAS